jgi:hypothetical protein
VAESSMNISKNRKAVSTAVQLYQPSERRLSAKLVPTFENRGRVVSARDPHGRTVRFLDRSCYCFLQVAPQLYSRG